MSLVVRPLFVSTAASLLIASAVVSGCDSGSGSEPAAARWDSRGEVSKSAVMRYRSDPGLRPGGVRILRKARGTAPGYLFYAPKNGAGQNGPTMVDNNGDLVWFKSLGDKTGMDFKVGRYENEPVLSWWQGNPVKGWGRGEIAIVNSSYETVATIRAKGKWEADHHDHLITDDGTILIFVYVPVRRNASSIGGARNATVMDGTIQEIDIASGRKLFEWSSLEHVGLRDSYKPPPKSGKEPWDYFHINSVQVLDDGNLLVGARNTHAVYKVNRKSGKVIWRLGGKRSNFKMGRNTRFSWQHDTKMHAGGLLTVFDNAAAPQERPQSRGIKLNVNTSRRRVSLAKQYTHPRRLLAQSQANMQILPNGNVLLGWGAAPYVSEHSKKGRVLFDLRHLGGTNTYRAYRFPWTGKPTDRPAIAARSAESTTIVYASWNGATEVSRWRLLAGPDAQSLKPVGEFRRRGFETQMRTGSEGPFVAVEALDSSGKTLGSSKTIRR